MNLHEYQSKQIFSQYGISIPKGEVIENKSEIDTALAVLDGPRVVVKAQVHAGGRGKVGGVVLVDSHEKAKAEASRLLGSCIVTKQTGKEGLPVNKLLLETPTAIAREIYLSVLVDRESRRVLFMASSAGGMNIEEVAAQTPEKIFTVTVDPAAGIQGYQCRKLAFSLELEAQQIREFQKIMYALYQIFQDTDASLIEINPLVVTEGGSLLALDAKINLDDNALYRHAELQAMRDISQEDEREAKAAEHDLNYITLDGNIGCMVNGAGLAMATMDLVKLHGGQPANFLDVGGGTTAERVAEAFKLILSDNKVKAVLVNIFGGIVRCDLIAEGIISAVKEVGIKVPVVVRLEGTNAEQGLEMLNQSGLSLITATGLTEAAKKVVEAAA